jgi:EAL domain-containing protein (putative c-di-GMP-specific phosphodiesterase class I)
MSAAPTSAELDAGGIEADLAEAIKSGGITLAYQPKYDFFQRRVTGVEALARWQHPSLGTIPPAHFIPLAEKNGLIHALGTSVLQMACRQAAQWLRNGARRDVSINVSPLQLADEDGVVGAVAAALSSSGLPADTLELEVTESALMDERAGAVIDRLLELGARIALDDFGVGYSSLAQLKRLRIHTLKIDKSFVDDIPGSIKGCVLLGSIASMAHGLGMRVVAEGAETLDQIEVLDLVEVDAVQGYAISRPLPAESIEALIDGAASPPPTPPLPVSAKASGEYHA